MTPKKPTFNSFLKYFPELDLPLIIKEDAHHEFSKVNKPLPKGMIDFYIIANDEGYMDEFTEYIPCFQVPNTEEYKAIVYFKANLLVYEYFLITYNERGEMIGKEKIAGMLSDGDSITRAVATIKEDLTIHIVEGKSKDAGIYEPSSSKAFQIEILEDGHLVFSLSEDML